MYDYIYIYIYIHIPLNNNDIPLFIDGGFCTSMHTREQACSAPAPSAFNGFG